MHSEGTPISLQHFLTWVSKRGIQIMASYTQKRPTPNIVYETTLKISFTFHTQSYGPFTWRRENDICYFIKIRSTVSGVRVTTSWYNIRRKAELVLFTKTCTCLFTIILCSNHFTLGTIFVFHTLIVTVIMGYTIERG